MFRSLCPSTGLCVSLSTIIVALTLLACQPAALESTEPAATTAATEAVAATDTPASAEEPATDANTDAEATAVPQSEAEASPAQVPLLEMVGRAEGLEDFASYAETTGLTEQLQGDGPFTLFVAPNTAFSELPEQVLADPAMMEQILKQQLLDGAFLIQDLIDAESIVTLAGTELAVMVGQEGGTVNGANILGVDFAAQNGVIHVIDTVMLPPDLQDQVLALYPAVVGEETYAMQGNLHIDRAETSPVPYNSTPPTSGPHFGNIVAWQVYEEPFVYEQLVHNLEDGGVIIYYQCAEACPDLFQQLSELVQPLMDSGRHVVLAPNDPTWTTPEGAHPHADMGAPIAVVAWRKLLKLDEFDADRISQFIEAYEGIDHHVK